MAYGGATLLFLRVFKGLGAGLGALYGLAVIAVVGVTRLSLHTHTLADVAAGLLVGSCFAALFDKALRVQQPEAAPTAAFELMAVMIVVAAAALATGVRISSTQFL